jgi:hypothetical protein
MSRGVKLDEDAGSRTGQIPTATTGFSKKDNKANRIFWLVAGCVGLVIVAILAYVFLIASK